MISEYEDVDVISLERVERDAWLDIYACAPFLDSQTLGISSKLLGACGLLAGTNLPIVEFNRAVGLTMDELLTEEHLDQVRTWLTTNAAQNWAIQVAPNAQTDAFHEWTSKNGIAPSGNGWAKFYRTATCTKPHPAVQRWNIQRLSPKHAQLCGQVVAAGFGLPATVIPWFSALVGRPKWSVYIAFDGNVAAACGALYSDANWGWMGIDTTLSAYRGRGAQKALIDRRINDGIEAGLVRFTAETGQPSEAEMHKSPSYHNYGEAGFVKAYVRSNYKHL